MGLFHFPSNFVYWTDIKNHEEIKRKLIPKIEKIDHKQRSEKQKDNGLINASTNYNTATGNFLDEEPYITNELVWKPLNELLKKLNSREGFSPILIKSSMISDSWYTKYDKDGSFGFHSHMSHGVTVNGEIYIPSFSMIYILNDPNNENVTEFMSPTPMYVSTQSALENILYTKNIKEVKEGTLLIFPSSLYHGVSNTKIPGRITIAINVVSSFVF